MSAIPKHQVLVLYRQMLKAGNGFRDYGFKKYAQRRVRLGFEQNRDVTDLVKQQELMMDAQKNLKLLQRQSTVSQMFSPGNYYMDTLPAHH